MHSLPLFHRIAGTTVVLVGDGEMAAAKRRLIARAGGVCCTEDEAAKARLAFVAIEDGVAAEAAAMRLSARGLLVNVADRPELCDFTLPSVLERGEVLVAVSTGGASAALAKQLRLRLEALLPSSLADLAASLREARDRIRRVWPDALDRRHAIDAALTSGGMIDILDTGSAGRVDAWLEAAPAPQAQRAEIVLASDDPDDLTLREARLLGAADLVAHEDGVGPDIMARARADASRLVLSPGDAAPEALRGLTVILRKAPPPAQPGG